MYFVLPASAGGLWLWFSSMNGAGPNGHWASTLFFIVIPIGWLASLIAIVFVISPLWAIIGGMIKENVIFFAIVCALVASALCPLLYPDIPGLIGKLHASWWCLVWLGGMGAMYALLLKGDSFQPVMNHEESPKDEVA